MGNHRLPLLRNLRIASPCRASWDEMEGDERVRFCGRCSKSVYNISAMSEVEAEALIVAQEGELCARLFRRRDGTVMTSDCPVGVRRRRVTKLAAAALALGGAGALLALAPQWGDEGEGEMLMGAIESVPHQLDPTPEDGAPEDGTAKSAAPTASVPPVETERGIERQDSVPRLR